MNSSLLQTVKLGLKSLFLQKLRASLAALGIFIGTTTVIWLVAMGEGVSRQAQQQIKDLGATNIIVRSIEPNTGNSADEDNKVKTYGLLRADYRRILSNVPTVSRAVPMRELTKELRVGDLSAETKFVGCSEEHLELNQLSIARGRWFNSSDNGESVIVLAHETAKRLFPFENPIGRTVRVLAMSSLDAYTVIGQTKPRNASAAIGGSLEAREYNQDAYIPLSTFRRRIGDHVMWRIPGDIQGEVVELSQITVTVKEVSDVDITARIIESLLKRFHEQEDYSVVVPKELLRQAERTRAMFNVLLVLIAGISLLVGGIGIMNIMLATVTERTREIGVRRALGATRSHITQQFLTETIVLTVTGGLLGVGVGVAIGPIFRFVRYCINNFSPDMLPPIAQSLDPHVAPWSVGLALLISVGVGVLFGVYPARQAAYLDPIEALRHE